MEKLSPSEKAYIEKHANPGETYIEAIKRLLGQDDKKKAKDHDSDGSVLRQSPPGDEQSDFFIPSFYDVGGRDDRSLMDLAVFRLSKRAKRAGEIIRHDLPDGYLEISTSAYGMASIWDYDIVLMMISHLTEAMNRYRDGKGEMPGRQFRPHTSEILKFCRKSDGSRQYAEIEAALDRLSGTRIKFVRKSKRKGETYRNAENEGLIAGYSILSRTDKGKVASISIGVPEWIYQEVTKCKRPDVLTVHPDYFLIEPGIGRFIYRLARRAAGKDSAWWSFKVLYERSGSTGTLKKFAWSLRKLIKTDDLPEYSLSEQEGKEGPILVMTNRLALQQELDEDEDEEAAAGSQ